jgi:hypothetical protein
MYFQRSVDGGQRDVDRRDCRARREDGFQQEESREEEWTE